MRFSDGRRFDATPIPAKPGVQSTKSKPNFEQLLKLTQATQAAYFASQLAELKQRFDLISVPGILLLFETNGLKLPSIRFG